MWQSFNMNHWVKIQLTEEGHKALEEDHNRFWDSVADMGGKRQEYTAPKEDEDGWSKWQLWSLMTRLGPHIRIGGPTLFSTEIQLEMADAT